VFGYYPEIKETKIVEIEKTIQKNKIVIKLYLVVIFKIK
jgi:hypothetical protein